MNPGEALVSQDIQRIHRHIAKERSAKHGLEMGDTVQWHVAVDSVTDALVRSHLSKKGPAASLSEFVERAVARELDRIALQDHERTKARPAPSDDMWEIIIPLPLEA